MELVEILKTLTAAFGPAGCEGDTADVIETLARPYADEVYRDVLGNLICHRRGGGAKVMFTAHMDSMGLIVSHIEEEGYLRVGALGGVTPANALCAPVRFQNGTAGVIAANEDADRGKLKLDELYVDIGAASAKEAGALVRVGDAAVYDTRLRLAGDRIISPYLDDRLGCAVLLLAMEQLGRTDNDLWFVFTVQEELGLRGAVTAAYAVAPDYGIAVDVTGSGDLPGSKHGCSSVMGRGAAVKVMDGSVICHPRVVARLKALAEEGNIPFQMDVLRAGGTDAGAIHKSRGGVCAGGISIPCRYVHTPGEMASLADAEACVRLVRAFAEAELERV